MLLAYFAWAVLAHRHELLARDAAAGIDLLVHPTGSVTLPIGPVDEFSPCSTQLRCIPPWINSHTLCQLKDLACRRIDFSCQAFTFSMSLTSAIVQAFLLSLATLLRGHKTPAALLRGRRPQSIGAAAWPQDLREGGFHITL
jgi:hypothetical protein